MKIPSFASWKSPELQNGHWKHDRNQISF